MMRGLLSKARDSLILGATLALFTAMPAAAQQQVSLALDWIVGGAHSAYYVAREKGFYEEAGLKVDISRGFGSGDTVKRVASGTATFGIADTSTIISAMANDSVPVKIVGMMYDRATLGLIYLNDAGISKPQDLVGKSIGRSASGASVTMFPAFLAANNIDRKTINEVVVDAATYMPLLMSGRVQAVLEQSIHLSKFQKVAAERGKSALSMRYSDFGLDAYGNAIITSKSTIEQQPKLVADFVKATLRGAAWAMENPDQAIETILKYHPELDRAGTKGELLAVAEVQGSDDVAKNGLGFIDPAKLTKTRDTATQALKLPRTVPVEEIFTTEFLPRGPITFTRAK